MEVMGREVKQDLPAARWATGRIEASTPVRQCPVAGWHWH
ncbi:hypothetical protein E2C01_091074 [Portunus trituberculatus]|uniref:Uncharacterized protein n=1 Tax=Portunus trituberculatus TaxID=210409 RepID=A0A5B7JML0_PORTR|nr:hypothetical protein [Portunus trituberculatus]